jgi:ADP-dependent NAD(P)H-hydrate dehydratase / NAD(P)H-hydrate epimerase
MAQPQLEILTPDEMRKLEQDAMARGLSGYSLMERAGAAAAAEIMKRWTKREAVILCGPGNNGGDGFVVARHLADSGWPVTLLLAAEKHALKGDAASMARHWRGPVHPLAYTAMENTALIVDALFGTGLARPLGGDVATLVERLGKFRGPVIALDIPSGIDGTSGRTLGTAVKAVLTIAFCRKKPAHMLFPGRFHCGEIVIADIGIPDELVRKQAPRLFENAPELWRLPRRTPDGHKFTAGHAVVLSGGPWSTGAARLAAMAAQRIGAGLVTLASPTAALAVNASHLSSILLADVETPAVLAAFLGDQRRNVVLLGPGMGVGADTRAKVRAALVSGRAVVLDADALTSFEQAPDELFEAIAEHASRPVILTPHAGEFARLFKPSPQEMQLSKIDQSRRAADCSGAVIIYKGPDTVIASPDGRAIVNGNAPATLATAGSGDVLAGLAAGLLAQGVSAPDAAAAAAFIHGEAANRLGEGLIAEDLVEEVPAVLRALLAWQNIIGAEERALL